MQISDECPTTLMNVETFFTVIVCLAIPCRVLFELCAGPDPARNQPERARGADDADAVSPAGEQPAVRSICMDMQL